MSFIAAAIIGTSLFTAFLSSIFGMLGGLVLMALLANILSVGAAMVLHGLIQLTSNGYRAYLNRYDIDWKITFQFAIGAGLAMAALLVLAYTPERATVMIALGALPYIAAAVPKSLALDITRPAMPIFAGFVVVLTNLIAGVGGPLLDVFFQRVALTRHQVVATKAIGQSLGHLAKIVFFGGIVATASADDWPNAWLLAACLVMTIIGTILGKRILDKMHDATFFAWTQRIMLTLGALLIARGLYLIFAAN